ncbi:DNA alkylation repair protein [Flammeovirgaceae bacterium SG7u.111]|nr:DNA alkylation repair protein [Flammeovirgaceae bacterium SG7u.132]WPO37486.1 DNA alkylation repair protein [Flammeovirgaceae bacterium SG7u.111]
MTKEEAIARLEAYKNERGVANWERMGVRGMSSFGLGLTQIKKVGKEIGKDHGLALALWESTNFDVKTLAIIVEEPKKSKQGASGKTSGRPPFLDAVPCLL